MKFLVRLAFLICVTIVILLLWGMLFSRNGRQSASQARQKATALQAKCHEFMYANRRCTPGAVIMGAEKDAVCKTGFAAEHRSVSVNTKRQVYAEYGMGYNPGHAFVIDHLIPLELGGDNIISNLWPEKIAQAARKDQDENGLRERVCEGNMRLDAAQMFFVHHWSRAYNK